MDEDSQFRKLVKCALGATGLGTVSAAFFLPHPYGIIVAVTILFFAVLLFGGYFLWRRRCARREREQFSSAVEAQTAATPKAISDPNRRADLDRVRQKFQTGLQEYRKRGKDLYKLPWYVIIGESGSGKTEAIRHSGIDFPPGLQDELQGSGGTVNMDWWFTNRGIILDTAGSMLFNESRAGEAPEWREFLRLLKRSRPQCPVNGLFLVLSVESLIRDSADTIAQKASRIAQQLDIIQRALDVRFPVYLVVTKCDLLAGFREFFDSIDDPLLQHQMFGWSNPDPLDAAFRPDLVEQYLGNVAARLRRRRMALIRDSSGTGRLGDTQQFFAANYQLGRGPTATSRRLDEMDSLFALPESVMRLAPRLRRYLEAIFVAGEWSAKPVFLRGLYFTSSMREGKALDEAIALATGLPLDQLPEDRSWEKGRAFFLRDLFHEKVFRESGLVTRATNTLQLLRRRQLAIFGSAGAALLLLLVFAAFAYHDLNESVGKEALYWQVGATNRSSQGEWLSPIIRVGSSATAPYLYAGDEPVPGLGKMTLVEYQKKLRQTADKRLKVGLIFKPLSWMRRGKDEGRPQAQRLLFEDAVLKPLIFRTRDKMQAPDSGLKNAEALNRHREALLALIRLEADSILVSKEAFAGGTGAAEKLLRPFLSYLTETNCVPDTNLVEICAWTYGGSNRTSKAGQWPPGSLLGGNTLASNPAISAGLKSFHEASSVERTDIDQQLALLNDLTDRLKDYHEKELAWLTDAAGSCTDLAQPKALVDTAWAGLEATAKPAGEALTNLSSRYLWLRAAASKASASALSDDIKPIMLRLPQARQASGFLPDIMKRLGEFASQAAATARSDYGKRSAWLGLLDTNCMARPLKSGKPAFELRWDLYSGACALAKTNVSPLPDDIGSGWARFNELNRMAGEFEARLVAYKWPLAGEVSSACNRIASNAVQQLKSRYVADYANLVSAKLREISEAQWTSETVTKAGRLLEGIKTDLDAGKTNGIPEEPLREINKAWTEAREAILKSIDQHLGSTVGFPVALNSTRPMGLSELAALRSLLRGLDKELQGLIWNGYASLKELRTRCDSYAGVVNALITDDGKNGVEWELYFMPTEQEEDKALMNMFRYVQVTIGAQTSNLEDLTRQQSRLSLCKGSSDAPLKITFGKFNDRQDTPGLDIADWGLIRLISLSESAKRLDDGSWQIRIRPKAESAPPGALIFGAKLTKLERSLPTKEAWPK